jgi:hypothetical protein
MEVGPDFRAPEALHADLVGEFACFLIEVEASAAARDRPGTVDGLKIGVEELDGRGSGCHERDEHHCDEDHGHGSLRGRGSDGRQLTSPIVRR